MTRSKLFVMAAVVASFAWLLGGGCGSADRDGGADGGGATSPVGDASSDTMVVMQGNSGRGGGPGNTLSPLCGEGACVPDDVQACSSYEPPVVSMGGAGGAAGGEGGGAGDGESVGGAGGEQGFGSNPEAGGQSGAAGAAGQAGEAGAGGAGGQSDDGPTVPPSFSCQVAREGTKPVRRCEAAGTGKVNAPCFSAADCESGLGCVTQGEAGRCLRYCCGGDSACDRGTYCAEQQLRQAEAGSIDGEPTRVPVCVPGDDCSLEDDFPCPEGQDCRCQGNTACMVVRSDRTTACVTPGNGKQGEACPCEWNHVCSSVTHTCVKICHTDPAKNDCGDQKCQASSELPPSFGVCVGPGK